MEVDKASQESTMKDIKIVQREFSLVSAMLIISGPVSNSFKSFSILSWFLGRLLAFKCSIKKSDLLFFRVKFDNWVGVKYSALSL